MPTHAAYIKYKSKIIASIKSWRARNPEKVKFYREQWNLKNKHRLPRMYKNRNLKYKFGITILDYDRLVLRQNNLCKICLKPPKNNALAVDHDHKTGKIRGLLCVRCNLTLGWFEKHIKQLQNYLGEQ